MGLTPTWLQPGARPSVFSPGSNERHQHMTSIRSGLVAEPTSKTARGNGDFPCSGWKAVHLHVGEKEPRPGQSGLTSMSRDIIGWWDRELSAEEVETPRDMPQMFVRDEDEDDERE